jgi:hypothetical protein
VLSADDRSPPGRSRPLRPSRDGASDEVNPEREDARRRPSEAAADSPNVRRDSPRTGSADTGPRGVPPAWDEEFLREIDQIEADLVSQTNPTPPAPPSPEPASRAPPPDWREDAPDERGDQWGAPSPYLEERLQVARTLASRLTNEVRQAEQSVTGLRADLESIDRELDQAYEELTFERGHTWGPVPEASGSNETPGSGALSSAPSPPPVTGDGPFADAPSGSDRPGLTGSYADFTLGRYNATVSALHSRRRSLAWGTVVAASGISALLLVLTLRAAEPLPPIWLAGLPLVWMVPVPFFMAAFRGTQRILHRNRLELPEHP